MVAADVRNSTAAIDGGRYKHVNTVGVSVIAAVRNIARPVQVPYVFGGDGAVVCIPVRFAEECRRALAGTIAMADASFGLELRACVVPIEWVRREGFDVFVARHRVSAHYIQCALYGGGAAHVERSLKRGALPAAFRVRADPTAEADYRGLECRWSEIPSPHDETVAVIVDATPMGGAEVDGLGGERVGTGGSVVGAAPAGGGAGNVRAEHASARLHVYSEVMQHIRSIYGEPDDCRPVAVDGLTVSLSRSVLDNELGLTGWRRGPGGRALDRLRLRLQVVIGWVLLRFGIRWAATDWGSYRSHLVANTDFRKFDGSLRLVLSGTADQRQRLAAYLDRRRDAGELAYGLHVARSAVMTCLIEERQGAHFHFVDAAGGGYAAAALVMKGGVARTPTRV